VHLWEVGIAKNIFIRGKAEAGVGRHSVWKTRNFFYISLLHLKVGNLFRNPVNQFSYQMSRFMHRGDLDEERKLVN
jgi:hypothetical protein